MPSLDSPGGDFREAAEMSVLKNKNQFKRQIIYLGSKNCNSGCTDLGRNPNWVLIKGDRIGF